MSVLEFGIYHMYDIPVIPQHRRAHGNKIPGDMYMSGSPFTPTIFRVGRLFTLGREII